MKKRNYRLMRNCVLLLPVFALLMSIKFTLAAEDPYWIYSTVTTQPASPAIVPINKSTTATWTISLYSITSQGQEIAPPDVTNQYYKIDAGANGTITACTYPNANVTLNGQTATIAVTGANTSATAVPLTVTANWSVAGQQVLTFSGNGPGGDTIIWSGPDGAHELNGNIPNPIPVTVVAVGIDRLQYKDSNNNYDDISNTMYVLKGTTVAFNAVVTPANTAWPSGKPAWSGVATGTGGATSVTFNDVSNSGSDFKVVTAECGNTVSANVIVYSITPTLTSGDAADFPNHAPSTFGVMEAANLGYTIAPTGINCIQIGGLKWTANNPNDQLINVDTNVGTQLILDGTDGLSCYQKSSPESNAAFTLTIQSGPSNGAQPGTETLSIVAPSSGSCIQRSGTNIYHRQANMFSIGIRTDFFISPSNVSFEHIQFEEGNCPPGPNPGQPGGGPTGWFGNGGDAAHFTTFAHNAARNGWTWCQIIKANQVQFS